MSSTSSCCRPYGRLRPGRGSFRGPGSPAGGTAAATLPRLAGRWPRCPRECPGYERALRHRFPLGALPLSGWRNTTIFEFLRSPLIAFDSASVSEGCEAGLFTPRGGDTMPAQRELVGRVPERL